jgi:hypothetical protein
MLLELAQSPEGPVQLMTGGPPAPVRHIISLELGLAIIGAIVAVALVSWAILARRAAIERNPSEYAFRALARQLGVSHGRASLIRKLAAAAQCAPVALLVSDHALQAAIMCMEQTAISKRMRAAIKDLLA